VKRIVDIHQGKLLIHNREQGGLEAIILLPLPKEEPEDHTVTNPIEKLKQSISEHF
jgi:two-component system osmolarity sensor histidine kinase EnvZ